MTRRIRPLAELVVAGWLALGTGPARADTRVYQAAQVELDLPSGWNVENRDDGMMLAAPDKAGFVIVRVLAASQLEQAIKEADAALKKVVERVQWGAHPTRRTVNGMKAIVLAGTASDKGLRLDVGAVIVATPASQVMLVLDFVDHGRAGAVQPAVDQLVSGIRPSRPPAEPAPRPAANRGDGFTVSYETPQSPQLQPVVAIARGYQVERIADALNQLIVLPRPVPIVFAECGTSNAAYLPDRHTVVVCYELVASFIDDFRLLVLSGQEALDKAASAVRFTLLHELGHALIGELQIPVLGREEDAADEFAAILLAPESGTSSAAADRALESVLAVIQWFNLKGRGRVKEGDFAWSDEHSFDLQRMYGIVCILYGANPQASARLVGGLSEMTPARLQRCIRDYPNKRKAWGDQLQRHGRK